MAPAKHKANIGDRQKYKGAQKGSMKQNNSDKIVILGSKHDKKPGKDINKEPEMKELKRMIRKGELDPDRATEHLKDKATHKGPV